MNTQTLRNDTDLHQILAIFAAVFATAGGLIHLTVTRQHLDFPAPDLLGGRESQVAEHRPRDLIERVRSLAPSATGGATVWAGDRGGTTSPIAARAAAAYNGT